MGNRYEPKDHIQAVENAPMAEGSLDQRDVTDSILSNDCAV